MHPHICVYIYIHIQRHTHTHIHLYKEEINDPVIGIYSM